MLDFNFDWMQVLENLMQLSVAYLLAFPIGWDREREDRSAGLRTFPLVAVGSCGYVLIGLQVLEGSAAHARILYGLMTGIGFIGGGAILRDGATVRGTSTAAAIWITGAVGAAVAWYRLEIALALTLLNFATMRMAGSLKSYVNQDRDRK